MTHRAEDDPYDAEDEAYAVEEEEPEKRGLLSWILIIALLVGTGSGSALAWRSFGGPAVPPGMSLANADRQISQADIEALQKQLANSIQSTEKLLAAQQAEIKRLADQVTALTGKLDMLQRPMTSAQAALPAQTPPRKPAAAKPVAAKPDTAKPDAAKPAGQGGPISTGGAPLPPPVQLNR